jgi:hypothetical protein
MKRGAKSITSTAPPAPSRSTLRSTAVLRTYACSATAPSTSAMSKRPLDALSSASAQKTGSPSKRGTHIQTTLASVSMRAPMRELPMTARSSWVRLDGVMRAATVFSFMRQFAASGP